MREQRMVPGVELAEMQLSIEVFHARQAEGCRTLAAFAEADREWEEASRRLVSARTET